MQLSLVAQHIYIMACSSLFGPDIVRFFVSCINNALDEHVCDFFFVVYDEKVDFLKLIKTQLFLHLFGLLKKYVQKSVRGEYFLQQIMNGAFSASLLF